MKDEFVFQISLLDRRLMHSRLIAEAADTAGDIFIAELCQSVVNLSSEPVELEEQITVAVWQKQLTKRFEILIEALDVIESRDVDTNARIRNLNRQLRRYSRESIPE